MIAITDNGTSRYVLTKRLEAVYESLNAARDAMREAAPNARDYSAAAMNEALAEHWELVGAIDAIIAKYEVQIQAVICG